ncbi:hypothetical protein [Streptomyces sp. NPDC055006]
MSDTETTTGTGAETSTETTETSATAETSTETTDSEALGEAGKKALKVERDARKAAEKTAQESATKLTELEAEVKRLQRSNAAVKGTDMDAVKAEIRAEFADQLRATAIKSEAKGRLTDAADTERYPEYFKDVDANDEAAVKAAVDKLLQDKPYLAAESGTKPWGDVGGGQRKTTESEPATPVARMARAYGNSNR